MTPTKKIVLVTTAQAAAPIVANRFIGFDGKQAKAAAPVLGVSPRDAEAGDTMAVECIGIALVEAGGAVAKVAADANGCAVAGETQAAGYAVTAAAAAGDVIAVLLKG